MSQADIKSAVVAALETVAPETDPAAIDEATSLRDALDLDSMDFLNFLVALHASLGVSVPEAEYSRMRTMRDAVAYLSERLAAPGVAPRPR